MLCFRSFSYHSFFKLFCIIKLRQRLFGEKGGKPVNLTYLMLLFLMVLVVPCLSHITFAMWKTNFKPNFSLSMTPVIAMPLLFTSNKDTSGHVQKNEIAITKLGTRVYALRQCYIQTCSLHDAVNRQGYCHLYFSLISSILLFVFLLVIFITVLLF